jgi:stage V sporulation protein AC
VEENKQGGICMAVWTNRSKQKKQSQFYQDMVSNSQPKRPLVKNLLWAFFVGGGICVIGQLIQNYFMETMGLNTKEVAPYTATAMVFLGALFTGLGVYDELGKHAGAGSIVPITGFANSVAAPALEFKREGYVFGVGAKMFIIAGPVIVYGTMTAVVVGLIKYFVG